MDTSSKAVGVPGAMQPAKDIGSQNQNNAGCIAPTKKEKTEKLIQNQAGPLEADQAGPE
jgi:hypothetical protein